MTTFYRVNDLQNTVNIGTDQLCMDFDPLGDITNALRDCGIIKKYLIDTSFVIKEIVQYTGYTESTLNIPSDTEFFSSKLDIEQCYFISLSPKSNYGYTLKSFFCDISIESNGNNAFYTTLVVFDKEKVEKNKEDILWQARWPNNGKNQYEKMIVDTKQSIIPSKPSHLKYDKMKKYGTPNNAIKNTMILDGMHSYWINKYFPDDKPISSSINNRNRGNRKIFEFNMNVKLQNNKIYLIRIDVECGGISCGCLDEKPITKLVISHARYYHNKYYLRYKFNYNNGKLYKCVLF
eukprot:513538_1